jgi:hypothetical protein
MKRRTNPMLSEQCDECDGLCQCLACRTRRRLEVELGRCGRYNVALAAHQARLAADALDELLAHADDDSAIALCDDAAERLTAVACSALLLAIGRDLKPDTTYRE